MITVLEHFRFTLIVAQLVSEEGGGLRNSKLQLALATKQSPHKIFHICALKNVLWIERDQFTIVYYCLLLLIITY